MSNGALPVPYFSLRHCINHTFGFVYLCSVERVPRPWLAEIAWALAIHGCKDLPGSGHSPFV